MRKKAILVIILLFIVCSSSCGVLDIKLPGSDKNNDTDASSTGNTKKEDIAKPVIDASADTGNRNDINNETTDPAEILPDTGDDIIVRWDEETLVMVRIFENSEAEITFALDRWAELHDIFNYTEENFPYIELPITGTPIMGPTGNVNGIKDACVGKVKALDTSNREEFVTPTVILLMEDGTVEWVCVSPFIGMQGSYGKLPWLKDIVLLSYEQETDGIGDMTIYATDINGLRYDVRIPCSLMNLFDARWICPLWEEDTYSAFLEFTEDGEALFIKGWIDSEATDFYEGNYEITLAENSPDNVRPGIISFDVTDTDTYDTYKPFIYRASYFIEMSSDGYLNLHLSDGEPFYYSGPDEPMEHYRFYQSEYQNYTDTDEGFYEDFNEGDYTENDDPTNVGLYNDDELIEFLLANASEANERVNLMRSPLEPYISGDITEIEYEGICRNVWLVSNAGGEMEFIILYTISDVGSIYEYDKENDVWKFVNNPFAVG